MSITRLLKKFFLMSVLKLPLTIFRGWLVALVRCSGGASPGARSRDHRALPSQSVATELAEQAEAEATLAPAPGR